MVFYNRKRTTLINSLILFRLREKLQLIQAMLSLYEHVCFIQSYDHEQNSQEREKMLCVRYDNETKPKFLEFLHKYDIHNKTPTEPVQLLREQILRSYGQETPIDGAQIEGMVKKLIQQSTSYENSRNDETVLE